MFYDQFVKLCKARGVSPSAVMVSIGLNKSNATFWKRGSIPKGDTLQKLADYFGVSVDYLLGKDTVPYANISAVIHTKDGDLSVGGYELLRALEDMTADELADMQKFAEFILNRRQRPVPAPEGKDTTPPPEGAEEPPEGK